MGTKGSQNWYQSTHYDALSCRQVSFTLNVFSDFLRHPNRLVSKHNRVGLIRVGVSHSVTLIGRYVHYGSGAPTL
jgi:hypothetical protein